MTKQIDARLAALEKRDAPPGKLLVCSCATNAGRRNVEERLAALEAHDN